MKNILLLTLFILYVFSTLTSQIPDVSLTEYLGNNSINFFELESKVLQTLYPDIPDDGFITLKSTPNFNLTISEKEHKAYLRHKWFWDLRIDKNGGYSTYTEQYLKAYSNINTLKSTSNNFLNNWEELGPKGTPIYVGRQPSGAQGTGIPLMYY